MNDAFQSCHFDYRLGKNDAGPGSLFSKADGGVAAGGATSKQLSLSPTIKIPKHLKKRTLWVACKTDLSQSFVIRSEVLFKLNGEVIVRFPVEGISPNSTANANALALNFTGLISLDTPQPDATGVFAQGVETIIAALYNLGAATGAIFLGMTPHTFICAADEVSWEISYLSSPGTNTAGYAIAIRSEEVPAGTSQAALQPIGLQ
jgi:hypothetical protein